MIGYSQFKASSKARWTPCDITEEEFEALVAKPHVCGYCGHHFDARPFRRMVIDHIIPVSRVELSPTSSADNLAIACHKCNGAKRAMLPLEWALILWDKTSQFKTLNYRKRTTELHMGPYPMRIVRWLLRIKKESPHPLSPDAELALVNITRMKRGDPVTDYNYGIFAAAPTAHTDAWNGVRREMDDME